MNNRQGGRRRGRGGQQSRNGQPGNPHSNSRVDNRQRGNAAQLLEKYKTLARDAQMAGDRVNTEYYLQFADHYFRVLSESRSRYEEQRPQRRDEYGQDYGTEDEGDGQRGYGREAGNDDGWDEGDEEQPAQAAQAAQQAPREPRGYEQRGDRRQPYPPRANGGEAGNGRYGQSQPQPQPAPNGNGGNGNGGNGNAAEIAPVDAGTPRIEFDRLPPALNGAAEEAAAPEPAEAEAPAPKPRRGRRPKLSTDGAPAEA